MGDKFFVITEGEVVVTRNLDSSGRAAAAEGLIEVVTDGAGHETLITNLYEGHFFGETSIVTEQPRNANVRVPRGGAAVKCMSISKAAFTPFLSEDDDRFRTLVAALVRKNAETARKRAEMLAAHGPAPVAPAAVRNEVKVTTLAKKGRSRDGKQLVNGYELTSKLGQGAYGVVWLALSPGAAPGDAPHKSAVKIVSRALLRKKRFGQSDAAEGADEEMLREVAVMKRLQHRNVVALHEVINDPAGDKFYIVQEFMELGPVMTELEYSQPLPPDVARSYFRDALAGLEYLHFQGIVHRDIKPSNLLIAADGTCKLADFGTAYILRDGTDLLSEVRGTPAFQPPEVFDSIEDPSLRYRGFLADVWALGATLHTMVVGAPPYLADSELELISRLRSADLAARHSHPSWAPKRQLDFILHNDRVKVTHFRVPGVVLSDHLPLICDFEVC